MIFSPQRLLMYMVIVFVAMTIFIAGPVMRETDQATILQGAIEIARTYQILDQDYYLYDKAWFAYWQLAIGIKVYEPVAPSKSISDYVYIGNIIALITLSLGVIFASYKSRIKSWQECLVWFLFLFSPVIILSSSLLSLNIISMGWAFFLLGALRITSEKTRIVLSGFFTLAAVGSRQDMCLVLPLICLLNAEGKWSAVFSKKEHWVMGGAAVCSIVFGRYLWSGEGLGLYPLFFNVKITAVYFLFGLGAVSLLIVVLIFLLLKDCKPSKGYTVLLTVALSLPLIFYMGMLFTPRHFTTTAFACCVFGILPFGQKYVRKIRGFCSATLLLVAILPLFVGLRIPILKKPSFSFSKVTLYPTNDGLWPMGSYLPFLLRLSNAVDVPVDANQRLWNAYSELDSELAKDNIAITRTCAYGLLWKFVVGNVKNSNAEFSLLEERSLGRIIGKRHGYSTGNKAIQDYEVKPFQVVGESQGMSILRFDNANKSLNMQELPDEVVMRLGISSFLHGEDFYWREYSEKGSESFDKNVIFCSLQPFTLKVNNETSEPTRREIRLGGRDYEFYTISSEALDVVQYLTSNSVIYKAEIVLPNYMHLKR